MICLMYEQFNGLIHFIFIIVSMSVEYRTVSVNGHFRAYKNVSQFIKTLFKIYLK